jgi:hypothetical protein
LSISQNKTPQYTSVRNSTPFSALHSITNFVRWYKNISQEACSSLVTKYNVKSVNILAPSIKICWFQPWHVSVGSGICSHSVFILTCTPICFQIRKCTGVHIVISFHSFLR